MSNILLISELYPLPTKDNKSTAVCHYYTREWVKNGQRVIVVHMQPVHCLLWHFLVWCFPDFIFNRFGGIYYAKRLSHIEHYTMDVVNVYRVPIFIPFPHGRYSPRAVASFVSKIHKILEKEEFVPDIITGHMMPLEIIPSINRKYGAKTCMVSHGISLKTKQRYPDRENLIRSYDMWGYRSESIRRDFVKEYFLPARTFICYSGIPSSFIPERNPHRYHDSVLIHFLYVGDLIERKYPIALMQATSSFSGDAHISYVGEGPEKERLKEYSSCIPKTVSVSFLGKQQRSDIISYYDKADCFVMISRDEAYGLVYLEAMARGCITIASRNEGIDGVIKDGENGFLCEAGNAQELSGIIERINAMPEAQKQRISDNAFLTASSFTDKFAAADYLNNLQSVCK